MKLRLAHLAVVLALSAAGLAVAEEPPTSLLFEASLLYAAGDYQATVDYLKKIEPGYAKNADFQFNMAASLLRVDRRKEASRYAEKALQIDPHHAGALEIMGDITALNALEFYQRSRASDDAPRTEDKTTLIQVIQESPGSIPSLIVPDGAAAFPSKPEPVAAEVKTKSLPAQKAKPAEKVAAATKKVAPQAKQENPTKMASLVEAPVATQARIISSSSLINSPEAEVKVVEAHVPLADAVEEPLQAAAQQPVDVVRLRPLSSLPKSGSLVAFDGCPSGCATPTLKTMSQAERTYLDLGFDDGQWQQEKGAGTQMPAFMDRTLSTTLPFNEMATDLSSKNKQSLMEALAFLKSAKIERVEIVSTKTGPGPRARLESIRAFLNAKAGVATTAVTRSSTTFAKDLSAVEVTFFLAEQTGKQQVAVR